MSPESLTIPQVICAVLVSALVIFATRLFPFVIFSKKAPPKVMDIIALFLPPMMIAILLVYCLKDANLTSKPFGIPEILSLLLTVSLHLWKKNSMLSIFSGTILYMILIRLM